jgi:small subunit ribosomal protein S12e
MASALHSEPRLVLTAPLHADPGLSTLSGAVNVHANQDPPGESFVALHKLLDTSSRQGNLVRGGNAASKALMRDSARLCVLASNCTDSAFVQLISSLCSERGVPLFDKVDGATIGEWAGLGKYSTSGTLSKSVGCSCVVITTTPLTSMVLARTTARGSWG